MRCSGIGKVVLELRKEGSRSLFAIHLLDIHGSLRLQPERCTVATQQV